MEHNFYLYPIFIIFLQITQDGKPIQHMPPIIPTKPPWEVSWAETVLLAQSDLIGFHGQGEIKTHCLQLSGLVP